MTRLGVTCLVAMLATSCVHHRHTVGLGPTGTDQQSARQWYVLFGLIAANEVSAQRMSAGLTSYSIESEYSLIDMLLQPLIWPLTLTTRTVTVRT